MQTRKHQAGNGSKMPIELIDPAGVLAAHGRIAIEGLATCRLIAAWLHQVRAARGLPQASPQGLWAALTSGQRAGRKWTATPASTGGHTPGDRAWREIVGLRNAFAAAHQLAQLDLVVAVAGAERMPAEEEIAALVAGLAFAAEHIRTGRRKGRAAWREQNEALRQLPAK